MNETKLTIAMQAVCPIHGVSIGRKDDKKTWRIDAKDGATVEQLAAAQAVLDSFVWDAPPAPAEVIVSIEQRNPIPHRGQREKALTDDLIQRTLREKINALDAELAVLMNRAPDPLPEIPVSRGLLAVKAVDDAIKIERAKL